MAEFGMKATELSAPQGAGANVVGPTTVNPLEGIGQLIEGGASLFSSLKKNDDDTLVSNYSKALSGIANSDLDPFKKRLAQQKLFSDYNLMGNGKPEILKRLAEATKFHRESGNLGDAESAFKDEQDIKKARIKQAASEGVFVDLQMPEATQNEILRAQDAVLRNRQTFKDLVDRQTEFRANKRFVTEEEQAALKKETSQALSAIGATQSDFILAQTKGIVEKVSSGQMPWEVAQQTLTKIFADTAQTINSLAGEHPELASNYRSMFNDMRTTAFDLVDPSKRSSVNENALKDFVNRAKLLALQSDRSVLAAHVTNTLLPQTTSALVASEGMWRNIFTIFGAGDPTKPGGPQVAVPVGSDGEKEVIKITTTALEEALNAKGEQGDKARTTAANALNNVLLNTRQVFANPLAPDNPQKLNNTAQLISNPAFGRAVAAGMVKPDALMAAAEVMQTQYQKPIFDTIQNKLNSKAAGIRLRVDGKEGFDSPTYMQVMDVKYGSGGVEFIPKPFDQVTKAKTAGPLSAQDAERGYAAAVRNAQLDMREVKTAIDSLVKQQAHLEGHFDYAKTFEKMRPQLLQGMPTEAPKAAPKATDGSYAKEADLAGIAAGEDSGAGMTRGVIDSVMKDLDKLTPKQRKEFQDALAKLK